MFGRDLQQSSSSQQPQHWTVHAEFTISQEQGVGGGAPTAHTETDENGVRMVYTWTSQPLGPDDEDPLPPPSLLTQPQSHKPETTDHFLFTSVPPVVVNQDSRKAQPSSGSGNPLVNLIKHDSSGYSSELLSPNSLASGLNNSSSGKRESLSSSNNNNSAQVRQQQQPYNRRCRSTCSIVLSTSMVAGGSSASVGNSTGDVYSNPCSRAHSLRCQTPTAKCCEKSGKEQFYGCGDPWCYHSNCDEFPGRFSPVLEGEEYISNPSTKRPSRCSTHTAPHGSERSKSSPPKVERCRDASVQTYEMVDKCTSPYLRSDSFKYGAGNAPKTSDKPRHCITTSKDKKRPIYASRRKTEPIFQRVHSSASSLTPDSLDSKQYVKRLVRPSPVAQSQQKPTKDPTEPTKPPRTVHIDVYCTGTEIESDSTTSDEESTNDTKTATTSSPQTVYESDKVRITRVHNPNNDGTTLPARVTNTNPINSGPKKLESIDGDSTATSSCYPSQLSSFAALRDFDSFSTVPWSRLSMSSSYEADSSLANTTSDIFRDSLDSFPSRSKFTKPCKSIDEIPEREETLPQSSTAQTMSSLDSFSYDCLEDKSRIKQLEQRLWKSPQVARKHLLQTRRIAESGKVEATRKWNDDEDSDELSDQSEQCWSFVKDTAALRKISKDSSLDSAASKKAESFSSAKLGRGADKRLIPAELISTLEAYKHSLKLVPGQVVTAASATVFKNDTTPDKKDSFEDRLPNKKYFEGDVSKTHLLPPSSEPPPFSTDFSTASFHSPSKSPSILAVRQKLADNPSLRAPFTLLPGVCTEQRAIAKKFGRIVDVFRKPGHHIGPAKNPACKCDHCTEFSKARGFGGRARSTSNEFSDYYSWKKQGLVGQRGSEPPQSAEEKWTQLARNSSATDFV